MTHRVNITCSGCGYRCSRPRDSMTKYSCASCGKRHEIKDLDIKIIVRKPTMKIEDMMNTALRTYRSLNPEKSGFSINHMDCLIAHIRHQATNWNSIWRAFASSDEHYLRLRLAFTRIIRSRVYTDISNPIERLFQNALIREERRIIAQLS